MAVSLFGAAWKYRGFILGNVKREFQMRYRNSILGATWSIINPIAMIVVYTVIFSQVMQARLHGVEREFAYGIFLCSGVMTWGFFAEIVNRCQTVFIENGNLIKKMTFPRICLPLIIILSASLNFFILFGLFVGFLALTENFPGWVFFGIFPALVIQTLFAIGLGMIIGVLNVFFRDVGQLAGVVIQFWFWFTPIVYPISILSDGIHDAISWNPMTSIIQTYQTVLVHGQWPQWDSLLPVSAISLTLCLFGLILFRKRSGEMVDEL
ncbi:MAG: ABC transporter permease [Methylococcaceae bacterium]|nr:ABC transporter permease [Methylococcaceae bacterium]